MWWLREMKEHIRTSFHIEKDDFENAPFDSKGGLGKLHQLFGQKANSLVSEMNEALVA